MNTDNATISTPEHLNSRGALPVVESEIIACSVSTEKNRTPMSTLTPTPMTPFTASLISHNTLMWLCNPVAIAGHVNRSLSLGTGFFKLQLQLAEGALLVPMLVNRWSCNLKKHFMGIRFRLLNDRTPMTVLLSPLHMQHRHIQQLSAAVYRPVASAGYYCRLHPLESALLNRLLRMKSVYLKAFSGKVR